MACVISSPDTSAIDATNQVNNFFKSFDKQTTLATERGNTIYEYACSLLLSILFNYCYGLFHWTKISCRIMGQVKADAYSESLSLLSEDFRGTMVLHFYSDLLVAGSH